MTPAGRKQLRHLLSRASLWSAHYQDQVICCEDNTHLNYCKKEAAYWRRKVKKLQNKLNS